MHLGSDTAMPKLLNMTESLFLTSFSEIRHAVCYSTNLVTICDESTLGETFSR